MCDDASFLEAEILIDTYGIDSPLVHLAQLASPACRIEPQLLRQLRLDCVPEADVSVEQALWFSDLVDSRGSTITFRQSVTQVLRARLRELRTRKPEIVRHARMLMENLHSELPPLLLLEDKLAWAGIFDDDNSIRSGAQDLLSSLFAGRAGLDHWLGRAWHGLPSGLKKLPEGHKLAQVAATRGAAIEQPADPNQVAGVAHMLPSVPLLLQRDGSQLHLSVRPEDATHAIEIPRTRPLAVAVESVTGSEEVILDGINIQSMDVGRGTVNLRTLSGQEYELEAFLDESSRLFDIEMMPAEYGTSLLIRYGDESDIHQILINGGTRKTGQLLRERFHQLNPEDRKIELLVITNINAGNISGVPALLEDVQLDLRLGEVWFNGERHVLHREEWKTL